MIELNDLFNINESVIKEYTQKTVRNIQSNAASEVTYYDDFKRLIETIFPAEKGYLVQVGSKLNESVNKPDITVSFKNIPLLNIEAKPPFTPIEQIITQESQDRIKDQIFRYRHEGIQLLLTDFLTVFLIDSKFPNNPEEQKIRFKCQLIEQEKKQFRAVPNASARFSELLTQTCENSIQTISNVRSLINPLANIASELREKTHFLITANEQKIKLEHSQQIAAEYLEMILKDFKKSIFKEEMDNEKILFADLFAQTIVYGAFSAWIKMCQKGEKSSNFSLNLIGDYLPFGSFLREFFLNLKNKIPKQFQQIMTLMETRFQKTEYPTIMSNVETLVTTFYSDFLNLYDPKTAKERGVVYTPHEIVEFMVDGIDFMLKRWLNKPEGIISPSTNSQIDNPKKDSQKLKNKMKPISHLRVLDPAAGTMAFASGYLHLAYRRFLEREKQVPLAQSAFESWVKKYFFQNMYAFEILMAPYVLGHIRTFLTLEEMGVKLNAEENHLKSFLMNTLMTPLKQHLMDEWMFNNQEIGREIKEALDVRDKKDIFVIMGNPPYNLSSQNNCEWINEKIVDYKVGLNEKNKKILNDDYVKFLRFGQWKIEEVGTGILAFITNNKYLDGQMFSVMRKSLRKTFDHIYIINLHGDMRKKESGNVFDIRVGVAIAIMIRIDDSPNKKAAIHYMDIPESTRDEKFARLLEGFQEHQFKLLSDTPTDLFVEIDVELMDHYNSFAPIDSFFIKEPTSGVMVGRDHLLMDVDQKNLEDNLSLFFQQNFNKLDELGIKTADTKTWDRQNALSNSTLEDAIKNITFLQYRGFDRRYLAYDKNLVEGHRKSYIGQINIGNPAITVTKASRKSTFCTAFISDYPIEKCFMSVVDTAYGFLLKFDNKSNIKPIQSNFPILSEDLFYYIYAILWAPTYRTRYDSYLRQGYPRIPITKDQSIFLKLAEYGKKLAAAHLLKISLDSQFVLADLPPDQWKIKNYHFEPDEKRIYFDKTPNSFYIDGITSDIWNFSIGEILQIEEFLDVRKYSPSRKWNTLQRPLNHEEMKWLLMICTAIKLTLSYLPEIDDYYCQLDPI